MSFFRVSNPSGVTAVNLYDLGVIVAASASNLVLSDQFEIHDLVASQDLEAAIQAGTLTVEIDYGTGYTAVSAGNYTNRDGLGAFLNIYEITNEGNNEDLVDGSEASALHHHDSIYFTETELGGTGGGDLIGVDDSAWNYLNGPTVQDALDAADVLFGTAVTLDAAYDNDTDGVLDIDGTTKPLILRSNNVNDFVVDRESGVDIQDFLRADVSANELLLGSLGVGALAPVDVRILRNLIVDGDITFTGTITDTTVNELNVENADVRLRTGAAAGADANIFVERGSDGADASLLWDEADDRWKAGLEGSEETIALLERDESVSGTWTFTPTPSTDPNMLFGERASAPTTQLGAAGEIPVAMMPEGQLAVYDKSASRDKWLSVDREVLVFTGRSSNNNKNEYAYTGLINSFETGVRIPRNMTLVGIAAQTQASATWTARVRKNGSATNLASLALTAVAGAQDEAVNLDLAQGDQLQVFIDTAAGAGIAAPVIRLKLANRY